jgi:hypothetical protein
VPLLSENNRSSQSKKHLQTKIEKAPHALEQQKRTNPPSMIQLVNGKRYFLFYSDHNRQL